MWEIIEMSDSNAEYMKIEIDYFKHLSTLSTGAIVILTVFIDKLFANPIWKPAIIVAFFAFLLSGIAATVVYSIIVARQEPLVRAGSTDNLGFYGMLITLGTWGLFFIGLLALSVFATANLIRR